MQYTAKSENVNDKGGKRALVVKLTPVEALDSAVMRMLAMVKGLQDNGYDVTILAVSAPAAYAYRLPEDLNGCHIVSIKRSNAYDRISKASSGHFRVVRELLRTLTHRFFIYDHTYEYLRLVNIEALPERGYDVIISVSDPKTSHLAVAKLIRQGLKYGRWLQYWGDPLSIDITSKVLYPRFIKQFFEKKLMGNAEKIIYASPTTAAVQRHLFPQEAHRISFCVTPYLMPRITGKRREGSFRVGYFGSYMKIARNIMPFYQACRELKNAECMIVGNGDIQLVPTEGLQILPRGEVHTLEDDADLLVCILNRRGTQIPGKAYHYAATDKAILVVVDGEYGAEIKAFLSRFNRYYFCENNKDDILRTIDYIRNEKRKWQLCPDFAPDKVARQILADR